MSKSLKDLIETKEKRRKKISKLSTLNLPVNPPVAGPSPHKEKRWSKRELRMLYKGLSLFGTDFSAIATIIPQKTRNQVIHKYHREDKINKTEVLRSLKKHEQCESTLIKHFGDILPSQDNIRVKGSRFNSVASADSVDVLIKQNLQNTLNLSK